MPPLHFPLLHFIWALIWLFLSVTWAWFAIPSFIGIVRSVAGSGTGTANELNTLAVLRNNCPLADEYRQHKARLDA